MDFEHVFLRAAILARRARHVGEFVHTLGENRPSVELGHRPTLRLSRWCTPDEIIEAYADACGARPSRRGPSDFWHPSRGRAPKYFCNKICHFRTFGTGQGIVYRSLAKARRSKR